MFNRICANSWFGHRLCQDLIGFVTSSVKPCTPFFGGLFHPACLVDTPTPPTAPSDSSFAITKLLVLRSVIVVCVSCACRVHIGVRWYVSLSVSVLMYGGRIGIEIERRGWSTTRIGVNKGCGESHKEMNNIQFISLSTPPFRTCADDVCRSPVSSSTAELAPSSRAHVLLGRLTLSPLGSIPKKSASLSRGRLLC